MVTPVYGGPRRSHYFPALDGLRTTAVVAVVLFHAGVAEAPGGFLGVSLFFTLSGFLITRLLLVERARDGRIALGAFWGRRVRRLAPAALVCLIAVLLCSRWLVTPLEMRSLRADIVASAANVANWRFLTAGQSYAQLFAGRPSPVLHFWSLAIEEQFYFVFPCLVALLLAVRRRWALPIGLAVLAAGSLVATLASTDHDLIYYGTHTRAGELLIGAFAAWLLFRFPSALDAPGRLRVLNLVATASLVGFVVLIATAEQSDGWLYRGGFMAVAVLWCPMIVAATTTARWAGVVGWSPLAAVGRRSYGIYVFHWPVFTLLTPGAVHLGGWVARLAQVVVIVALTEVSFRFVERPVRERRVLGAAVTMRIASLSTIGAIIAIALVVPAPDHANGPQISMLDVPDTPVLLTPTDDSTLPAGADATHPPATATATAPGSASHLAVATPSTAPSGPVQSQLRVTVIGSDLSVARSLNHAASGLSAVRLVNLVLPHCSSIAFADSWPLDPSCPDPLVPVPPSDVLVVALGSVDHAAFTDRLAASRMLSGGAQFAISQQLDHIGVSAFAQFATLAATVVVIDTAPQAGDFLDGVLGEATISTTGLLRHPADGIDRAFLASLVAPPAPTTASALRVLVVGDSTSYGVATGLAGSSEHLAVLWAGKRNCGLIPVEATTLVDVHTPSAGCPTARDGWPAAVASFRPDVVLAVASLPEEAPQQYPGDLAWYAPGSTRYTAEHDAGMLELVALAATTGAVVEVTSAPNNPLTGARGWTSQAGIDAWNAQILSWDAQSTVVQTIDYAGLVASAETAAGHSMRPDGVHLDDASVASIIGGSFAPLFVQQVMTLRRDLALTGCLVSGPDGNQLDLAAC